MTEKIIKNLTLKEIAQDLAEHQGRLDKRVFSLFRARARRPAVRGRRVGWGGGVIMGGAECFLESKSMAGGCGKA